MRNLTQEAIQLAERNLIEQNPQLNLSDPVARKNLPPLIKQQIVTILLSLQMAYEEKLVAEIRGK